MMLGSLSRMNSSSRRTVWFRMKRNQIVIKNSGAEVPGCSLDSENPPKNRHQRLFFEFGVSALPARHTILVIGHDHTGSASRAELLCQYRLTTFCLVTGGPAH